MIVWFFKQKSAYDVRMSAWRSDVCSSDLHRRAAGGEAAEVAPAQRTEGRPHHRMAAVGRDHLAGEGIVLADEGGDEGGLRVLVDLGAGADLLDDALAHHRDAVRHRQRLALVVGDVDEGDRKSTRLNSSH